MLEGSVRKSGGDIRITAQLIDTATGQHQWAEKYDIKLDDIFSIQDEIVKKILTELQVKLTEGEQARLYAAKQPDLDIYLRMIKAKYQINLFSKESLLSARKTLKEIIDEDFNYGPAYAHLGWIYWQENMIGASDSPKENVKKAMGMAQKAMALGDAEYEVQGLLCYIYTYMRKFDEAIEAGKKVISLSPGSANCYGYLSLPVLFSGDPERAILLIEKAMRLNPIPPNFYFAHLGIAYRMMGQYNKSLEFYKKFYGRSPNNVIALLGMAAAYSLLGNNQEARIQAEEVMKVDPDFSLEDWITRIPFKRQEDRTILYTALQDAGLK